MAKVELKQPVVQAIAEDIKDAASVVLVDYRGLTVAKFSKNPFCLFIVVIQALKIPRKYIENRNGTNLQDLGNIMLEKIVP